MQRFQHNMRTSQHVKSVQTIMTRTHNNFSTTTAKPPHLIKLSSQGDNITTFLRKFEIHRENENLAKRILLCESEHSRDRYMKEWQNVKRFMRVRSNFKKTLHATEPKIFRFEPILGKGRLKVSFEVRHIELPIEYWSKKSLYRLAFLAQPLAFTPQPPTSPSPQIQPDKKLLPMDFLTTYQTTFYAPLSMKRKPVICKIYQVNEIDYHEVGRFCVDLGDQEKGERSSVVLNKAGKGIGMVRFCVGTEGGAGKKMSLMEKENGGLPALPCTQDTSAGKIGYCSEAD